MTPARVVALIPSLRGEVAVLRALVDELRAAGAEPYIVPTGRTLERTLTAEGLPVRHIGANPGFGVCINRVAGRLDWDWLLIVNDDVTLDGSALRHVLRREVGAPPEALRYLDPTPPRAIPGAVDVFAQVSLLSAVRKRLRAGRGATSDTPRPTTHFGPFSLVLLSRPLWDGLDGFAPRLLWTFEDADFARRAVARGADVQFAALAGAEHRGSVTGRRQVHVVLPVAVWSAAEYLRRWYTPTVVARLVCLAALAVRLLAVPVTPVDRASHVQGIARAARALLHGTPPSLTRYEDA